jgi:catechol 2,3-dioxygenase-like lactoylglutathione lyase family enzyme
MALLQPTGLAHGHYECRSLDETLPIFTDLMAAEIVGRAPGIAAVKHPNTDWLLVIHEGGEDSPRKPLGNHYGFRVADHTEVEAAYTYIKTNQKKYGITTISRPHASHFAYSIYMKEPGGNTLEIEYYNPGAAAHGRQVAARHWTTPLSADRFPGRGYVPQALSHGTLQARDKAVSDKFYTEVLGLDILGGGQRSTYIGHADTPWYIVVLPVPSKRPLAPVNRFTLTVASASAVRSAHDALSEGGKAMGIYSLGDLTEVGGEARFQLSDLDRNWWEISSSADWQE